MLEMSIKRKPSNKSKRRDKKDNADYMNFHRCNRLNENIVGHISITILLNMNMETIIILCYAYRLM